MLTGSAFLRLFRCTHTQAYTGHPVPNCGIRFRTLTFRVPARHVADFRAHDSCRGHGWEVYDSCVGIGPRPLWTALMRQHETAHWAEKTDLSTCRSPRMRKQIKEETLLSFGVPVEKRNVWKWSYAYPEPQIFISFFIFVVSFAKYTRHAAKCSSHIRKPHPG